MKLSPNEKVETKEIIRYTHIEKRHNKWTRWGLSELDNIYLCMDLDPYLTNYAHSDKLYNISI